MRLYLLFICSTVCSSALRSSNKACIEVGEYFHDKYLLLHDDTKTTTTTKKDNYNHTILRGPFTFPMISANARHFHFETFHEPDELKTDEKDIMNMAEQLFNVFHPEADLEQSRVVMNSVNELYDKHVPTLGTDGFFEALRIAVSNASGFR
jgi:hypothetical protein